MLLFLRGDPTREIFFCVLVFWPSLLGRKVSAKVFRTLLVSGLHVGLHNSAIPAGFRQDFLPRVLVDTKWIHIVRSMARLCTDNGQTVEYRYQKN